MTACRHLHWVHRACADPNHSRYACHDCGLRFALPLLTSKPQLYWLKHALRAARRAAGAFAGVVSYSELACLAKDVPYILTFLQSAGFTCKVPEFSAVLLVGNGPARGKR